MSHTEPARTPERRVRSTLLAALVVAIAVILGYQSLAASSSATPPIAAEPSAHRDGAPAVGSLDPDLLGALRHAKTDATGDGVEIHVTSGWRSRKDQERLFREAVSKYGSEQEAARWVAIPGTSSHESGDAIDIGHSDATAWLSEHGAGYGLCQIYRNEPWHFELRPDAIDDGCPPMYADPTHDPRLQHA